MLFRSKRNHASLTRNVLIESIMKQARPTSSEEFLEWPGRRIPLLFSRHPRARRYLLRLRPDGSARVTIPRGGSLAEGKRFAERNLNWLERQWEKVCAKASTPKGWTLGTDLLWRGGWTKIEASPDGDNSVIRLGDEVISVPQVEGDLRRTITAHLWRLATRELPARVLEFAALHQLPVRRVTVRNQSSRWGSCSRRGTISINWRLIQTPPFVRDYIILHELMHLRQMNHSARFWQEVERVCPAYETAEHWLKQNTALLK